MLFNKKYIDQFEALLFDLDGTLVDSMGLHNQAWILTLHSLGCSITEDILFEYAGIANPIIVEMLNHRFNWNLDPAYVVKNKEQRFLNQLSLVEPINSVVEIAKYFSKMKSMAIVSGGDRQTVEKTLDAIQLSDLFKVKVCSGDTKKGKPYADPFLYAAELLNVKPEKCLVFEDGEAGIKGATQAKMEIIKVHTDHSLQIL